MILTVLKYWQPILAALVAAAIAYLIHTVDVDRLEAKQRAALAAQADALHVECSKDKKVTTEVSNDYEAKITALNNQLATVKRVRSASATCVPIASATGGRNATTGANQYARPYGVNADALLDYAAEAEKYRIQLSACQGFITKTWLEKGQ